MYRHDMTNIDPNEPSNFREIIGRWPSTRAFARDAGCTATLVRQWRCRDQVPAPYWPGIVQGAAKRGIAVINTDLLARLAARRRPRRTQ